MEAPNFIDPWAWYRQDLHAAYFRADEQKQRLADIYNTFSERYPNDGEYLLSLLGRGLATAREIREPYWELLMLYWRYRIETDGRMPIKETTILFVEATQRQYRGCSIVPFVYSDMIEAYVLHDPLSYQADILDGIVFTIENMPLSRNIYCHLILSKLRLLYEMRHFDPMLNAVKTLFKYAEQSHFYLSLAHLFSAAAYFELGDIRAALDNAIGATSHAQSNKDAKTLIASLMWQAAAYSALKEYDLGSERLKAAHHAERAYQQGLYYMSFEAEAEYWRAKWGIIGQFKRLDVYRNLVGKTSHIPYYEYKARVSLIKTTREVNWFVRLSQQFLWGLPSVEGQLSDLRAHVETLSKPSAFYRDLEQLA